MLVRPNDNRRIKDDMEYILNENLPLLGALTFAALGLLGLAAVFIRRVRRRINANGAAYRGATIDFTCSVCHRTLVFSKTELVPLSPVEMALVIRDKPALVGRKLVEYVCPYCEADHCFTLDKDTVSWAGANFYTPQIRSHCCSECNQPLQSPHWSRGQYDGRPLNAPDAPANYGLVCQRCGSVCCLECCRRNTRKPGADGALLCPRCGREGMTVFFHP